MNNSALLVEILIERLRHFDRESSLASELSDLQPAKDQAALENTADIIVSRLCRAQSLQADSERLIKRVDDLTIEVQTLLDLIDTHVDN